MQCRGGGAEIWRRGLKSGSGGFSPSLVKAEIRYFGMKLKSDTLARGLYAVLFFYAAIGQYRKSFLILLCLRRFINTNYYYEFYISEFPDCKSKNA